MRAFPFILTAFWILVAVWGAVDARAKLMIQAFRIEDTVMGIPIH